MKTKNHFLPISLLSLSFALLIGCSSNPKNDVSSTITPPIVIGDTVKEWSCKQNFDVLPMSVPNYSEQAEFVNDFGQDDDESILFTVTKNGYASSDALEQPYFLEEDAKNGDIISLYYYVPTNSNIKTLQLSVVTSKGTTIAGETINGEENEEEWIRTLVSFDTLDTFGSIRLNYTLVDSSKEGQIYVDKINIKLGLETVRTDYQYLGESLKDTYEEYFKVGTCMSANMLANTKLREITIDNFNSVTAENEGKPEQILDQKACQDLVTSDQAGVAITTKPFEKLYDWAEANHIGVRHHTFVWYSQTPAWFFTTNYQQNGPKASKDLMLRRMRNFIGETIETINERWPGLVYAIDVSNEAIENGNYRTNNNNWYTSVGEDFVYYSFLYANEFKDEEQELYYNDFSYDYQPNNCRFALETLLKKAIDEELIDGVGIQGHLDSNANMDNVIQDAKMIKEKGLKCQITELDITINGNDENNLNNQKNAYKNLIKKVLENNASEETDINAVIVWGIVDNLSWKGNQNPLLFNQNYAKKPCYYGFLEALEEADI